VKLAKNQTTYRRTRAARTIILDHKFAPFLLPGIVLANPTKKSCEQAAAGHDFKTLSLTSE
jgi:hypothetical protein